VDSHCHLSVGEGTAATLDEAWEAGLSGIVVLGAHGGVEGAAEAVAVASTDPERLAAVLGVHPHDAKLLASTEDAQRVLGALRTLSANPLVVAIGEIGLDFHYDLSPRDDQRFALRSQVRLARELGLPIVVHDRESGGECLEILKEEGAFSGAGVLFHCFSGDLADLAALLDLGAFVSIPGIVTYEKATTMHEVARQVPSGRYLVETDSPWLAPEPWRGHANRPALVLHVVHAIARLRGESPERVATDTAAAARRFFRWSPPPKTRPEQTGAWRPKSP
jgi:TatD DNase family protein